MTLIPVSRICVWGSCSSKLGASLWIGSFIASSNLELSSISSIGSPSTLNILPKVAFPTGTEIGAWVFMTFMPL